MRYICNFVDEELVEILDTLNNKFYKPIDFMIEWLNQSNPCNFWKTQGISFLTLSTDCLVDYKYNDKLVAQLASDTFERLANEFETELFSYDVKIDVKTLMLYFNDTEIEDCGLNYYPNRFAFLVGPTSSGHYKTFRKLKDKFIFLLNSNDSNKNYVADLYYDTSEYYSYLFRHFILKYLNQYCLISPHAQIRTEDNVLAELIPPNPNELFNGVISAPLNFVKEYINNSLVRQNSNLYINNLYSEDASPFSVCCIPNEHKLERLHSFYEFALNNLYNPAFVIIKICITLSSIMFSGYERSTHNYFEKDIPYDLIPFTIEEAPPIWEFPIESKNAMHIINTIHLSLHSYNKMDLLFTPSENTDILVHNVMGNINYTCDAKEVLKKIISQTRESYTIESDSLIFVLCSIIQSIRGNKGEIIKCHECNENYIFAINKKKKYCPICAQKRKNKAPQNRSSKMKNGYNNARSIITSHYEQVNSELIITENDLCTYYNDLYYGFLLLNYEEKKEILENAYMLFSKNYLSEKNSIEKYAINFLKRTKVPTQPKSYCIKAPAIVLSNEFYEHNKTQVDNFFSVYTDFNYDWNNIFRFYEPNAAFELLSSKNIIDENGNKSYGFIIYELLKERYPLYNTKLLEYKGDNKEILIFQKLYNAFIQTNRITQNKKR